MKKLAIISVSGIVVLMAGVTILRSESPAKKDEKTLLNDLVSKDENARWQASKDLMDRKKEIVKKFLAIAMKKPVGRTGESTSRECTVELFGEYRAEETVEFLVKNISYEGNAISFAVTPAGQFPCVQALAKIGVPGVKGIIDRLRNPMPPPTDEKFKLFVTVIRMVDGHEIGLLRLELEKKGWWGARGVNIKNLEKLIALQKQDKWFH